MQITNMTTIVIACGPNKDEKVKKKKGLRRIGRHNRKF